MDSQAATASSPAVSHSPNRPRVGKIFCVARLAALVSILLLSWANAAPKDHRIALVIGNSNYEHTTIWPKLEVPRNDADSIKRLLSRLKFDVEPNFDLRRDEFDTALAHLQKAMAGASVVVVYYAGHGITYDHKSYLVPVDAGFPRRPEEFDRQLYSVEKIVRGIQSDSRVVLLLMDACRENLLAQQLTADTDPQSKQLIPRLTRGFNHLLDGIPKPEEYTAELQSSIKGGLYLVYATTPGGIAADSQAEGPAFLQAGPNSPFTAALLKFMGSPGVEIQQMMTSVRLTVQSKTGGRQLPTAESTLLHPFYLVSPSEADPYTFDPRRNVTPTN